MISFFGGLEMIRRCEPQSTVNQINWIAAKQMITLTALKADVFWQHRIEDEIYFSKSCCMCFLQGYKTYVAK